MASLNLTGTLLHTADSGDQQTEEILSVLRNNYSEGDVGTKKVIAPSATEDLNLVDNAPTAGTFLLIVSDQPLDVVINASLTAIPCNELLVITASSAVGDQINSVSVTNNSATANATIRYYLVK